MAGIFHRIVARLLFSTKRARKYIQVRVALICIRVRNPTEENYKKISSIDQICRRTIHIPLILGNDDSETLLWNVDASYAVHPDMKSHTSVSLSLGHGKLMYMLCKQKLVIKRSTEAKLVGVDGIMMFVMWAQYFFFSQEQARDLPDTS